MKSSSWLRAVATALSLALVLFLVDTVRARLLEQFLAVKRREDAVVLPPPALTQLMSLGYRAALADLIFAHVLVLHGQHFQEKRLFELAPDYLDTITSLDPKFREPYRLADSLITLQPVAPPKEAYRAAKRIQDRALANFPYDTELWLISGQYMAYLAAPQLPAQEAEEYRLEGARRLARSCELVGSNENIPHHCITAAALYNKAGQLEAARGFLERVLAVTDDPEIQALAGGYLAKLAGQAERDRAEERALRQRALMAADLSFVSRDTFALLGPRFDTGRCAGAALTGTTECSTSFRDWEETLEVSPR